MNKGGVEKRETVVVDPSSVQAGDGSITAIYRHHSGCYDFPKEFLAPPKTSPEGNVIAAVKEWQNNMK